MNSNANKCFFINRFIIIVIMDDTSRIYNGVSLNSTVTSLVNKRETQQ
jgi:hypothetical protein